MGLRRLWLEVVAALVLRVLVLLRVQVERVGLVPLVPLQVHLSPTLEVAVEVVPLGALVVVERVAQVRQVEPLEQPTQAVAAAAAVVALMTRPDL